MCMCARTNNTNFRDFALARTHIIYRKHLFLQTESSKAHSHNHFDFLLVKIRS